MSLSRITTPLLKLTVLLVALVAVGAGTAAAAKLITGKQVKNRSLTGADIKKNSLGPVVLSAAAKSTLKGATGEPGAKGADGAAGATGPSDVFTHRREEATIANANTRTVATQTLPPGLYQVTSSLNIRTGAGGKTQQCLLRTGAATDIASHTFPQSGGDRDTLTLAGAVTIPAGAQGADAQVRLLCIVDGDVADVMNMTIVSTKTTNAPVTTE